MKSQRRELWLLSFVFVFTIVSGLLLVKPGFAEAAQFVPDKVLAKALSSTTIGINWGQVSGADEYRIYRSVDGTNFQLVGTSTGNANTYFLDQKLNSSTLYYYQITAYNSVDGESPQSTATLYSRTTTFNPAAPQGVKLVDNHDGTLTITWNANPEGNIQGYNIYRAEVSGGTLTKLNSTLVAPANTTFTDNTINYYLDYYYRVTAVDNNNMEGAKSPEQWIKPKAPAPADVPHVDFSTNSAPCASCHVTHTAVGGYLITQKTQEDLCFTCHDGTGSADITYQEFSSTTGSRHPVQAGNNSGSLDCSDCHNPHLNYLDPSNPKLLSVTYNNTTYNTGNAVCYKCHGVGSTLTGGDIQTPFESGIHNSKIPNPPSGTQIKCNDCHEPHASPSDDLQVYKEENTCYKCHAGDIFAQFNANPDNNTHHDITDEDQAQYGSKLECTNCHNPHGVTDTNKLVNPDSPGPTNLWTGSTTDFCLTCHGGSFPTDTQTAPYAPGVTSGSQNLINISNAWQTDAHGNGVGSSNVILDPAMGYSRGDVLDCTTCHEPHGSPNADTLKTTVTSKDGTVQKSGLLVYKIADGQYDMRYFCNACHGQQNMGNQQRWPTDCTSCHKHGSNSF